MNIRKPIAYGAMFVALDQVILTERSQVELYFAIGQIVGNRSEKGAAVAAAEYLQHTYPDMQGFSPRNIRRMRLFYSSYKDSPKTLAAAMTISWTQNVVILESDMTTEEKYWYIQAVQQFGWSKLVLTDKIRSNAHSELSLDLERELCYTDENRINMGCISNDKDTFYLSREYMPQPDGRVRDEGSGEKSGAGEPVPYRICGNQYRGNRQPGLPPSPPQAGRAWDRLPGSCGPPTPERRLRPLRPPDRDGHGQPAEYAPYHRRKPQRQAAPADGVCGPPGCRGGRSLVYR